MNKEALIAKVRYKARLDEKNRRDHRYLDTLGFLVAKGFLKTNMKVKMLPNKHLCIDDAIWAGENVEPRILEVLPAAVLRLARYFDLEPVKHKELARTVSQLRRREEHGDPCLGIPYEKLKVWADLPLRDKRVKPVAEKRVTKTFRMDPRALDRLRKIARERDCSEVAVLESFLTR